MMNCYVADGDRVLVLWQIHRQPFALVEADRGSAIPVAPSFEIIGQGSQTPKSRAEVEAAGIVWFAGRPDCTGPTYMAHDQAVAWIRFLGRGEIRSRAE